MPTLMSDVEWGLFRSCYDDPLFMWISERMWRGLTPVTPFAQLSQLPHTGG
jgi:hypothetical protein